MNWEFQGKSHVLHTRLLCLQNKRFFLQLQWKIDILESSPPCTTAKRLKSMLMSPCGGQDAQDLWLTHTLLCAAHLSMARVQMLTSAAGTLQVSNHRRSLSATSFPLSFWSTRWWFLTWSSESILNHPPLHGESMSSSRGNSGFCLQANKSFRIYFQRCQLVPYITVVLYIFISPPM